MLGLLDNLAKKLVRQGLRRGLIEGSTAWLVVGAASLLVRLLTRAQPEKVIRERLKLGETITVTHVAPKPRTTRRERRRETGNAAATDE